MMEQPVARYRKNAYDTPASVQLLLYQDAIQMYDTFTTSFIDSIPLRQIAEFTSREDEVTIHFRHNDDVKLVLDDDHPLLPEIRASVRKKWLKPGGKVAVLTAVVIASVIFLNYIFGVIVADIGLKLITPEYEAKLGDEMYQSAITPTMIDGKRTAMIESFSRRLKLSNTYNIRVSVVKSGEVNAFAVPGGHIVIYSGLIDKMKSHEELVALLGHEATHINERHTTRALLQDLSSKLFLIFFMDVSQVGAVLLLNADRLRGLSYSRRLETEADELGMKLMIRNKVSASGMVKLFHTLKQADTVSSTEILETHPLTDKRIRAAKRFINEHPQRDLRPDPELQRLWTSIRLNKFPGEEFLPE
ncbi:MAG TPA: M48 family metallopeptidase [Chitinophagaceae bacterium]